MKLLFSALLAIGMTISPVAVTHVALASTDVALECPPDAPEGWKRPGGYCELRNSLDTIGTEKGSGGEACRRLADIGDTAPAPKGKALLLAIPYDPCCDISSAVLPSDLPDGLLMRSDTIEVAILCTE